MGKSRVFWELWTYLAAEKKYWLLPVVLLLLLLGVVIVVTQTSGLAPFIYPLF